MIEDIYKEIADLPPPKTATPNPLEGAPPGHVRCACGKKFIRLEEITYHDTGIIKASDTECAECLPAHKDFALVICLQCRAVVAKVAPTKFKGGFEMQSNHCYHVGTCPTCHPGLKTSHVLEKYMYDKAQGLPVPDARDVLLKRPDH